MSVPDESDNRYLMSSDEYPNTVPKEVMVSVLMLTYNQAKYVREAIESILMQSTNFPFELCIGEDDSTDGTRAICVEYADRFSGRIRLFLRNRSEVAHLDKYSIAMRNAKSTLLASRGKYVALCDGDDYWTDRHKLQNQIDFMQRNVNCAVSFHPALEYWGQDDPRNQVAAAHFKKDSWVPAWRVILGGGGYMPTASTVYRRDVLVDHTANFLDGSPVGDVVLQVITAVHGKVRYVNSTMAVYRRSVPGSWSESHSSIQTYLKYAGRALSSWNEIGTYVPWRLKFFVFLRMLFVALQTGNSSRSIALRSAKLDVSAIDQMWKQLLLRALFRIGRSVGNLREAFQTK